MWKGREGTSGWGWGWSFIGGLVGLLLKTGQTTCYSINDDGDVQAGVAKSYTAVTTGDGSGTVSIQVAEYAAATISFATDDKSISDSAAGLVTFLTGDTIVIKGSTLNDGTYTIASGGGTAGHFHVTETLADEAAVAVVSMYKQTSHSNAYVNDNNTGLVWSMNTSTGEKVGSASTGTMVWYLSTAGTGLCTLYSSANTVSVLAGNIFSITGGSALTQFHEGDIIKCAGFANAVNNLPAYYVMSTVASGANLDITVDPGNQVMVVEGAVGDSISLVCRSIYNYAAGANLAGLGGQTDWRPPNQTEAESLKDMETPSSYPDAISFPGWPTHVWTSTSYDFTPAVNAQDERYDRNNVLPTAKTTALSAALVRGGL